MAGEPAYSGVPHSGPSSKIPVCSTTRMKSAIVIFVDDRLAKRLRIHLLVNIRDQPGLPAGLFVFAWPWQLKSVGSSYVRCRTDKNLDSG
jgi:hypothetical protein